MSRTTANLLLLCAGAIWGMGFVAQQTAMDDIGPLLFITLRFLLAGLVVTPFALAEMKRKNIVSIRKNVLLHGKSFFIVGLFFFLGMALQQTGLVTTSVTNAGFLTALYVILVPLIMVTLLRTAQPVIIWPASMLAMAGIYLLSGGNPANLGHGDMLIIASAFFWAGHVISTGRVGQATDLPVTMATLQFFITSMLAFTCLAVSAGLGLGEPPPTIKQLAQAAPEIIYAGVFAGGLGFTLQAIGQRYTSESAAAVLISTESLFAALFGALFLGERLVSMGYIGCGLIFASILMVELMPRKKETVQTKKTSAF